MKNPLFSIKNLKYVNNNNTMLNIRKFEIHRGACYMFDGKMASGKTLIIDLLSKNVNKYEGKIYYDGKDLSKLSKRNYSKDIAVVSQSNKRPFFGNVKKYIMKEILIKNNDGTAKRKFESIIKVMDIKHLLNLNLRKLTPSQFRWIDLAAKIASYPKILFIDEIELHLGKNYIESLSKILYRKCNYDGVSIIASSQNKEMFYNLISVNITVHQGRINKVRSFHSKSKKNRI
tara:strand:- start:3254 stop:3946 length:693 start_codon:yes stop_codon:yes gene_type:complete